MALHSFYSFIENIAKDVFIYRVATVIEMMKYVRSIFSLKEPVARKSSLKIKYNQLHDVCVEVLIVAFYGLIATLLLRAAIEIIVDIKS